MLRFSLAELIKHSAHILFIHTCVTWNYFYKNDIILFCLFETQERQRENINHSWMYLWMITKFHHRCHLIACLNMARSWSHTHKASINAHCHIRINNLSLKNVRSTNVETWLLLLLIQRECMQHCNVDSRWVCRYSQLYVP